MALGLAGSYTSGVLSSAAPVPLPPPGTLFGPGRNSLPETVSPGDAEEIQPYVVPLVWLSQELPAFHAPHHLRTPQMQGQPPPSAPMQRNGRV